MQSLSGPIRHLVSSLAVLHQVGLSLLGLSAGRTIRPYAAMDVNVWSHHYSLCQRAVNDLVGVNLSIENVM
jgi:hypothetical protein